jgi:hypothetical protein
MTADAITGDIPLAVAFWNSRGSTAPDCSHNLPLAESSPLLFLDTQHNSVRYEDPP